MLRILIFPFLMNQNTHGVPMQQLSGWWNSSNKIVL